MSKLVIFGKNVVASATKVVANVFIEIHRGKICRLTHFGKDPDIVADVVLPGFIDPHVHCRDWKESRKETLKTAAQAALHGGVTQIHDMPNTDPPILTEDDIKKRLETFEKSRIPVRYMLYAGLTAQRSQIREVVRAEKKYMDVAGLKLYAGESVGELGVTDPEKQLGIYKDLADLKYTGVLMVHCEKESELLKKTWSVNNPETWCDIRPPNAEIESVRDQLNFAIKTGFRGHLHFCHITLPESLEMIKIAPKTLRVSAGVTPHHLLLGYESMKKKSRGLYYKVNPPLRMREKAAGLAAHLLAGRVECIETDHAPHLVREKLNAPYASGMPELDTFSNFVSLLNTQLRIPFGDIAKLTSLNAANIFGLGLRGIEHRNEADLTLIDMRPEVIKRGNMKTKCGWSPYEGMTFPGRCKAVVISGNIAYLEKS